MNRLTNFSLISMINTLNTFADKKLPQKISYAITRNMIILQKEYDYYTKSLSKLINQYKEFIVYDENNNILYNDIGVPIISDKNRSTELYKEIENLLNIEIEINLYYIPENVFNYEDNSSRYDSLSASDILNLQAILCNKEGSDKNEMYD